MLQLDFAQLFDDEERKFAKFFKSSILKDYPEFINQS